jgi:hypothetical protein
MRARTFRFRLALSVRWDRAICGITACNVVGCEPTDRDDLGAPGNATSGDGSSFWRRLEVQKSLDCWLVGQDSVKGGLFSPDRRLSDYPRRGLFGRSSKWPQPTLADRPSSGRPTSAPIPFAPSFLTSAARRGESMFRMRDVSRHQSMNVLQTYLRDADLFQDHAGKPSINRARTNLFATQQRDFQFLCGS